MEAVNWVKVAAQISAGLCMGIGAIGPSLGQGFVGGKACEAIANNPESSSRIFPAMLLAIAAAETSSIYCLIVSMILVLK